MASANRTLVVIGSGPGIGRSVTTLFISNRYNNVALIARREEQLKLEKEAAEAALGDKVKVMTFALDVTDTDALVKALDKAEAQLGKAECIFYNAARVLPSHLLDHDVKTIEYDFKINVSALYVVAQKKMPELIEMARTDASSTPSLIVTSSMLPQQPIPQVFALSLVKAAQRNLVQSLEMTYASLGVQIGLINVGGPVSPDHEVWNPHNIAVKSWEWYSGLKEKPSFEVKI